MKRVVAALIWKDGKLLICQRTRHQVMPLKWEFPGGKIEEGEQPRDALRCELDEELGITATVGDEVTRFRHEYPNGNAIDRYAAEKGLPSWQVGLNFYGPAEINAAKWRHAKSQISQAIPGARFEIIDAGHFMPTTSPKALLALLQDFWKHAV